MSAAKRLMPLTTSAILRLTVGKHHLRPQLAFIFSRSLTPHEEKYSCPGFWIRSQSTMTQTSWMTPVILMEGTEAPGFLDTCRVHFLLPDFKVNGQQHGVVGVLVLRVVEQLDVVANAVLNILPSPLYPAPDPLPFQKLVDALRDGTAKPVAASAHAGFEIVLT